eukprot:CAMPEP_0185285976 /NCGR_PEP_ID=MMETSP1363-20130426/2017_1 /TAXON_ID=38817 /ORGANISM="Gephyrocapsa oceanica, Strain RCC1303" /LENGTH=140 /DNA_ID=CAMNT_0027881767 /DNA_START=94 /DNA_END=514 /DNA_ORIENTATION=-
MSPEARDKRHCGPGAPKLLSSPINLPGGCLRQTLSPSPRPRGSHNRAREAAFYRRMMIRHPADAAAVGVRREREVIIIVRRRSSRRPRAWAHRPRILGGQSWRDDCFRRLIGAFATDAAAAVPLAMVAMVCSFRAAFFVL